MDLLNTLAPAHANPPASQGAVEFESAPEHGGHKTAGAAHFADILGQTLAGPLFATWTPAAEVVATNRPTANATQMTALDPNGRRENRKRSRR